MKKLCSILLITALCVSLVACGSKNKEKRQVNSIVTTMGNNASFPSAVNVFSTTDLEGNTVTNDILSPSRRQRQMCIRDRFNSREFLGNILQSLYQ